MDISIAWDTAHFRGDWDVTAGDLAIDSGLRSAVLIAGWVWFRRSAVCVTLRSTSSVRSTRTSQMSREAAVSSMVRARRCRRIRPVKRRTKPPAGRPAYGAQKFITLGPFAV